jgi:ATP-dependent phosphofructokinase / diphosphate-dependent phosphofructokinase
VLSELENGACGAVALVRNRIHECLDITREQRSHTHRARFVGREDRGVGQTTAAESTSRLTQGTDDGMGGRVVGLLDPVMGSRDHRLVDDRHRRDRALATLERQLRLGERLAHEQLVVHGPMLADARRRPGGAWSGHLTDRDRADAPGARYASVVMTKRKRIAVLTGGGDVPGLNAVIKSVVYRATDAGYEVVGIRRGWEGLTHVQPGVPDGGGSGYLRPLDRVNTRTIDRTGGTILHTSRTNPRKMHASGLPAWLAAADRPRYEVGDDRYDLTPLVLDHLAALDIDVLVAIGGDDTLSYSQVLADDGVALMAIPKTMDNDVQGTEYCIGFSTAITRAKEAINRQRTTLGSHERIGVFRIFGRDAGFSALYTAYVTSARCVIPEAPYDLDALASLLAADHAANPSHYAFVITAEGAIWQGARMSDVGEADAFGHRHKANVGEALAYELRAKTGIETLASELTYDLRSGEPDSLDSMVATTFANVAMDLVEGGVTGRMVAIQDGKYAHTALPDPSLGPRRVDVPVMYNAARFRPRYEGKLGDPMLLVGLD